MITRGGKTASQTALAAILMLAVPCVSIADGVGFIAADAPIMTAPPELPAGRVNTTQEAIELLVPARERGPLGQVTVLVGTQDDVRVRASDLIRVLSPIVRPEAVASLQATASADGYITPTGARPLGFGLVFDTALLELAIEIPLEARQTQSLNFGFSNEPNPPIVTDEPAGFSAYLNYRVSMDYIHEQQFGGDEGFQSPNISLDFNGNVGKVAFENFFTVDPDADTEFRRNASRLIFDQPNQSLRWVAGDLIPEGASLQSVPDIAGLSVQRLYTINPDDRLLVNRSSQTVTLREPSTVEIRLNGVTSRTIRLPAGTYDLRDLPLTEGANAVEIVVEGASGAREVIAYDFFNNSTLLAVGLDEFSFSGGIRAERDIDGIDYQGDEPVFSGFYRRGITTQVTAGANLQATKDAVLAGVEVVYGSVLGLTSADLAFSERDSDGSGGALRVTHRYSRLLEDFGSENFYVSAETRSAAFAPVEAIGRVSTYVFELAANYSRPISRRLAASIGANYAAGRGAFEDRYGASVRGNWQADFDTNVNFGVTYNNSGFAGPETNVFVNVSRRFGAQSTISASAESQNGQLAVGYSRTPERLLDAWAYNGTVTRTDDAYGFDASANYLANRGELDLDHTTAFDNDGEIFDQRSSARVSGAIGFADGRFGIGRRITDSFALVSGHPSLEGRPVLLRGIDARDESGRSGAFGPALVTLGSYGTQTVPYDVEDLPLGYDLGTGTFELYPRLHNGYVLTVGSAYFVTATGILLDSAGVPLTLRSGRALSLDDPNAPDVEVITNRVGRFAVSGLSAGRWRFTFLGDPPLTYDIVVPATTLYRAGSLGPTGSGE